MNWQEFLDAALADIRVVSRRLSLSTPGVFATVPMLRGVWGRALHDLDLGAYHEVFEGGAGSRKTPLYLLRPAAPDPKDAPALEWSIFGSAIDKDIVLLRAWDKASGLGLGKSRSPFSFRAIRYLGPDGRFIHPSRSSPEWRLSDIDPCLPGTREGDPIRLKFNVPLRLIEGDTLVRQPDLPSVAAAIWRRLGSLSGPAVASSFPTYKQQMLEDARAVPTGVWQGESFDFERYSGSQKVEVEMRGVAGFLDLPEGPGPLGKLLNAACWTHLGKGTVMGLGQLEIHKLK